MRNKTNEITGTKVCKYCQAEIPAAAKVCPNCRKKQGIKIWQIILIAIVALGVLGMLFGGESGPTSEGIKEEAKEEQTVSNEFSVKEKINYNDKVFTVTEVKKYKGKEYENAKEGYEYVEVFIDIKNNSEETFSVSSLDWKMENSKGQIVDEAFVLYNSDSSFYDGIDLKKGGETSGSLVFEQPKNDKKLKLLYYENGLFDDEYTFAVKIK